MQMIKTLKSFNTFSILPKNDKVQINFTPITLKFRCKSCNKTNKAVIAHLRAVDDVDFDIANMDNKARAIWRLTCSSCDTKNDIDFFIQNYVEVGDE